MVIGLLACAAALAGFVVIAALVNDAPIGWSAPWIPQWNIPFEVRLDGLAAVYALLASGVAVLAFGYAAAYMPHHVEEQPRPRSLGGFFALLVLFMAAMLGLVASTTLLQLFVFWEITTICSYLLIGFDRHDEEARHAALMAMIVTGFSAVLLLAALLMLQARYGTTSMTALGAEAAGDPVTLLACALIVVAALAKSAQWPLHFWLPRAMAAPTPVSAYLHAAAMVAAGVFLLQRLQPLLHLDARLAGALVALGWMSMAAGGLAALRARTLKRILAYSTMAQYGHAVFLIGIGGAEAAAAASFFVVAHGVCKSALFLGAGAVTRATGADELPSLGGLGRRLPLLAVSMAVVAAGLAGVPLTIGYFKDELLFGAAEGEGMWLLAAAVAGPALTVAYMWRFWTRIFLGPVRAPVEHAPRGLVWPIAISAAVVLVWGLWPDPIARLAESAAAAAVGPASIDPAYHFDLRPTNVAALSAFAAAVLLLFGRRAVARASRTLALAGHEDVAEDIYRLAIGAAGRAAVWVRAHEPQTLRARAALVFVTTVLLVLAGQATVDLPELTLAWSWDEAPLAGALLVTAAASIVTATRRRHLTLVILLSLTSLALAAVCAAIGAPDVALVVIIINVVSSLLLVALLDRLPNAALEAERTSDRGRHRWRDLALAGLGGVVAFLIAWATFVRPRPERWIGAAHLVLSEEAHAHNAVTAILADFRGLDTIGEITVVLVSVVAVERLLRQRETQA